MRVIFLDIDGVLNTPNTWGKRPFGEALERPLVERASQLVKDTDADVVISSTWGKIHSIGAIIGWLAAKGFEPTNRIVDVTPDLENRAREIEAWLFKRPNVTAWVALDDDTAADGSLGHLECWVPINDRVGLTDANVESAKHFLTRG